MGYHRGERGRLASLVTVVILGAAVLSIDHISGRSVGQPARSEAANQVISMDLPAEGSVDPADSVRSDAPAAPLNGCPGQSRLKCRVARNSCPKAAPITNAIKLKAQQTRDSNLPVLTRITEISKAPCFLELQVDLIPPLEKRLIAAASQVASIRSVSIRIDGEVKINKAPTQAPAALYLIRASAERPARAREHSFKLEPVLVMPALAPRSKCSKPTNIAGP